jgi:hypothetical protein
MQPDAVRRDFVEQLNELYEAVNCPSLPTLRKRSEQNLASTGKGLVLAQSTTHDILTGKRANFPSGLWLSSFVNALRAVAAEIGLDPDTVVGTVADWLDRLKAARAAAKRLRASSLGSSSSEEPDNAEADADADDVLSGASLAQETAEPLKPAILPPAPLTLTMRWFLDNFGRTGGRLLRHAETGDAQAAYKLAILLLCHDQSTEARVWLRHASRSGHPDAPALYHDVLRHVSAFGIAYDIGREYAAAALVFYEAAAQSQHPGAAFEIALLHNEQGDEWGAAEWFHRAADYGHPTAQTEFNGIHRKMIRRWPDEVPPLPP